jgi:hypothetical protein
MSVHQWLNRLEKSSQTRMIPRDINLPRPRRRFGKLKANRRQDEQDLQDGSCVKPTGTIHSLQLSPVTVFILSILFILSKNQVSI